MPLNKKSKKSISNSLKKCTPIKKPEMSKNSNNSIKHMRLLVTPKNVECMTSMVLKVPKEEEVKVRKISSICSSVEVEEEEAAGHLPKSKSQNANLPKLD